MDNQTELLQCYSELASLFDKAMETAYFKKFGKYKDRNNVEKSFYDEEDIQRVIQLKVRIEELKKGMRNGWISVEERLPEDWNIVLANDGNNTWLCEYKLKEFYRHAEAYGGDRISEIYYNKILFWQQLPTPPNTIQ